MCTGNPIGTVPQRLMQRVPSAVTRIFRESWNFTLSVELLKLCTIGFR
jgi:hypothetical protein